MTRKEWGGLRQSTTNVWMKEREERGARKKERGKPKKGTQEYRSTYHFNSFFDLVLFVIHGAPMHFFFLSFFLHPNEAYGACVAISFIDFTPQLEGAERRGHEQYIHCTYDDFVWTLLLLCRRRDYLGTPYLGSLIIPTAGPEKSFHYHFVPSVLLFVYFCMCESVSFIPACRDWLYGDKYGKSLSCPNALYCTIQYITSFARSLHYVVLYNTIQIPTAPCYEARDIFKCVG